jgi:hypothetical protein
MLLPLDTLLLPSDNMHDTYFHQHHSASVGHHATSVRHHATSVPFRQLKISCLRIWRFFDKMSNKTLKFIAKNGPI